MAKILSQDPATGFVTLELDDGRTTVAPADVAYRAFPGIREPAPELPGGLGAPPVGWDQAPAVAPPAPVAPEQPQLPQAAPAAAPAPMAPVEAAAPQGPAQAPEPSFSRAHGSSGSISYNTARLPNGIEVNPAATQEGLNIAGQDVADAQQAQRDALFEQRSVKMATMGAHQDAANQALELMQGESARRAEAQATVQARLEQEDQRVQATLNAIPQSDPNHFWNSRTGLQQAVGIASAAIAGFLNPMSGKNQVVDQVMAMIDQDLRAQDTNIASAQNRANAQERAYGRVASRLESAEAAQHEAALYKLETVKAELAARMAGFGSDFTKAEYAGLIADLDLKSAEVRQTMFKAKHDALLADVQHNLDSRYKMGELAVRRGQLKLGWAEHERESAKDKVTGAGKPIPTMAPASVYGKASGFSTTTGQDFIIPGASDAEIKAVGESYDQTSSAAAEAITALRHLSKMDFGPSAKFGPKQRMERYAEASKAMLGSMSASGQTIARASDFDSKNMLAQFGGNDITAMQALLDDDGHMRKELIARKIDEIQDAANMQARRRGKVVDAYANNVNQRRVAQGLPTLTLDQLEHYDLAGDPQHPGPLLTDAQYVPPAWVEEFKAEQKSPDELAGDLMKNRDDSNPGLDRSKVALKTGEILLKEAKAGRYDADPAAVMAWAEKLHSEAGVFKESKNPAVRDAARDAARLSAELAKASVEAHKRSGTTWGGRVKPEVLELQGVGGKQRTRVKEPARTLSPEERQRQNVQLPPWAKE